MQWEHLEDLGPEGLRHLLGLPSCGRGLEEPPGAVWGLPAAGWPWERGMILLLGDPLVTMSTHSVASLSSDPKGSPLLNLQPHY